MRPLCYWGICCSEPPKANLLNRKLTKPCLFFLIFLSLLFLSSFWWKKLSAFREGWVEFTPSRPIVIQAQVSVCRHNGAWRIGLEIIVLLSHFSCNGISHEWREQLSRFWIASVPIAPRRILMCCAILEMVLAVLFWLLCAKNSKSFSCISLLFWEKWSCLFNSLLIELKGRSFGKCRESLRTC